MASARGLIGRVVGVGGNGIASLVPMSLLTAVANVYGSDIGGVFALVLTIGAYVAQLSAAWLVESRLAGGRGRDAVFFPRFLHVVAVFGVIAWLCGDVFRPMGYIGIVLLISALEVSRNMSLIAPQPRRDTVAAALLGVAALVDFIAASEVVIWVVVPILVFATVELRAVGMSRTGPSVPRSSTVWVISETAVNGLVQPIVVSAVLGVLGGSAATGFRLTVNVANLFSPVLSFVRIRLLSAASRTDVVFSVIAFFAIAPVVLGGDVLGFWSLVFREGWVGVSFAALGAAVTWKIVSLVSTLPFASLRRAGHVRMVFALRAVSSLIFSVSSLVAVKAFGSVGAVLCAFVVAEIATALMYWVFAARFAQPASL